MSNNLKNGLLLATAIGIALAPNQAAAKSAADWLKGAVKTVENAGNSAVNTVSGTANNVANDTTNAAAQGVGYANFAAAQAKGYADTSILQAASEVASASRWSSLAAADTASQAMGFKNYAERMASDSAAVGAAEYSQIKAGTVSAYRTSFSQASNTFEAGRVALSPGVGRSYSLAKYFADRCQSGATSSWGRITPYVSKAQSLNANAKEALYRLLRTLARGSTPDQQTGADMRAVGEALGLVTANGFALVGNAYQSNFSVSVGGSGGWIAGVNTAVSLAMDTFPTNGKYNMTVAVSSGVQVAAGTGTLAPGATIGFGLGWAPGSANQSGVTMTAGGTAGGVDVAAQWSVPPSLAQALITDVANAPTEQKSMSMPKLPTGRSVKGPTFNVPVFSEASLAASLTSAVAAQVDSVCQAPGISVGVSLPVPQNLGNVTFSPGYTQVVWSGAF